tara:strand:- start:61 stop:456 length:396 start_codon:yes stop_codon:yes gene_type:complete
MELNFINELQESLIYNKDLDRNTKIKMYEYFKGVMDDKQKNILHFKKIDDYIGEWFNECLDPDPENTTPFKDLCSYYQNWLDIVHSKNIKININSLKERLISWQNSKYGFKKTINGSLVNPRINLKMIDDH